MRVRVERLEHSGPVATAAWVALSMAAGAAMLLVNAPSWAWVALRAFLQF